MMRVLAALLAWWFWWRYMDGSFAPRALLLAVGLLFLGVGLDVLGPEKKSWLAIAGILGLVLAVLWPAIEKRAPAALGERARAFASNLWVWFCLFMLLWVYGAASQLILTTQRDRYLEIVEDARLFRLALQRYVLPRGLTPEQTIIIGQYLRKFPPPTTVIVEVNQYDNEASGFQTAIVEALQAGGWTVSQTRQLPNMQPGFSIHLTQSGPYNEKRDRVRNPEPQEILNAAFEAAGLPIQSSGSGFSQEVVGQVITLRIGPRDRSSTAQPAPWAF